MDFAHIRAADGTIVDRDFQNETAVAEEKGSCALQAREIHQWLLMEPPMDKLRAGVKRERELMEDLEVVEETPIASFTAVGLQTALDTTRVNNGRASRFDTGCAGGDASSRWAVWASSSLPLQLCRS